jgi:hypothetical protein
MEIEVADCQGGKFMSLFIKTALCLTAALFLITALHPRVVTAGVSKPEPLLLAQKAEPEKAKTPIGECPPPKPELPQPKERPQQQPEKMERKARSLDLKDLEPERAGTKKIGGHPIRAQETPKGE